MYVAVIVALLTLSVPPSLTQSNEPFNSTDRPFDNSTLSPTGGNERRPSVLGKLLTQTLQSLMQAELNCTRILAESNPASIREGDHLKFTCLQVQTSIKRLIISFCVVIFVAVFYITALITFIVFVKVYEAFLKKCNRCQQQDGK